MAGWGSALAVLRELKAVERDDWSVIGECPNDGTRLERGPDGLLFCPFDGWRP